MRASLALLALGLALTAAGCQRAPEVPPAATAPAVDHVAEAKKALAVAAWATAAPHLRAALQQEPDSLFLHYNLAICATWLDQEDEAVREFQWVLDHATSDSDEAGTARKWLAARAKGTAAETASAPGATDPTVGDGSVHGIVTWGDPPTPQNRLQLFLIGLPDTPAKELRRVLRTDQDGSYEFKRIPAGTYKLEVLLMAKPRWRLKVTLEPGQDLLVDLTPANSTERRDDFPAGS